MGNMVIMFALWTMIKDMRKEQFMIKSEIAKEMETIEIDIPDLDDLKQDNGFIRNQSENLLD